MFTALQSVGEWKRTDTRVTLGGIELHFDNHAIGAPRQRPLAGTAPSTSTMLISVPCLSYLNRLHIDNFSHCSYAIQDTMSLMSSKEFDSGNAEVMSEGQPAVDMTEHRPQR